MATTRNFEFISNSLSDSLLKIRNSSINGLATFDSKNPFENIVEFVSSALCLRLNACIVVRLDSPLHLVTRRHTHSLFVCDQSALF